MKSLIKKLERVANAIEADLGVLEFFGLLHSIDTPDSWELLVSSSALPSEKRKALDYLVPRVKNALTIHELVRLARIAPLPPNDPIIRELMEDESLPSGRMAIPLSDRFDRAFIIVPRAKAPHASV